MTERIKGSLLDVAVHLLLLLGAAMTMWLSFWLTEQGVRGSIPGLANWIPEIGHLLFQSRDMAVRLLKRRKLGTTTFYDACALIYKNSL